MIIAGNAEVSDTTMLTTGIEPVNK